MREIRFRAWDIKNRTMHDCVWVGVYECEILIENKDRLFDDREIKTHYPSREHPEIEVIAMQYTGLHDKDGVEIYEGDIVKATHFECSEPNETITEVNVVEHKEGYYYPLIHTRPEICEVIGNIYEHPELLNRPANQPTANNKEA